MTSYKTSLVEARANRVKDTLNRVCLVLLALAFIAAYLYACGIKY